MLRAHAPYSKFHVGAALRAEDGSIHGGCNVENAAYPQGLCAEAGAIAALVASGHKRILECVVVGPGPEVITPCGGCRQKLREFAAEGLVNIVGGCCGTTPEHIAAIHQSVEPLAPRSLRREVFYKEAA
eukprot:gene1194-1580_t